MNILHYTSKKPRAARLVYDFLKENQLSFLKFKLKFGFYFQLLVCFIFFGEAGITNTTNDIVVCILTPKENQLLNYKKNCILF